jgi:3-methyladenine DNA glycosylase AlkC
LPTVRPSATTGCVFAVFGICRCDWADVAEAFKNLLNPALVQRAAAHLQRIEPAFDAANFIALASQGLEDLEMKARAMLICTALEATLPGDFNTAAALLEAALAPAFPEQPSGGPVAGPAGEDRGLAGWFLWPVGEYIARHGQARPERALAALHALTQRFTAEFAIRPFIISHPVLTYRTLQRWTGDASEHVRRLASEGSRPRLPWGQQLKAAIHDPSPGLPLLLALQDDTSAYVRRSVANHLNDIARDHPALLAGWLETHLPGASRERQALLRHASRTLIKRGDARVLQAWGLGRPLRGTAALALSAHSVVVGESVALTLTLQSTAASAQTLAIDYALHHVKADGRTRPKVFKGWQVELPPYGRLELVKRHSMRAVTTRRYHAGLHRVEVQVNGKPVASAAFGLDLAH